MSEITVEENKRFGGSKAKLISRLTSITGDFLENESLFEGLDQSKIVNFMIKLFLENFSLTELEAMSDESLTHKIRRVLGVQAMAGLINDFTPEQMTEFDAAVSRR